MICFPNAKINLGLHVLNKREDGYHHIETVFFPVGFSDMLEVIGQTITRPQKCFFLADGIPINGSAADNLVVKAYDLLDTDFSLPPVEVFLYKKIAMGAGLGGGSSDAAFMLSLLNHTFGLRLTTAQLENYAARLGSDCAFFIRNKPAYLLGKGHELQPFEIDLKGYYLVMIYTGAHSSTALAYKDVLKRGTLQEEQSLKHVLKQPVHTWKKNVVNDFEPSVFNAIPELKQVKKWLYDEGAVYAAMSGSGSCMFGLFSEEPKLKGKWSSKVCHSQWL